MPPKNAALSSQSPSTPLMPKGKQGMEDSCLLCPSHVLGVGGEGRSGCASGGLTWPSRVAQRWVGEGLLEFQKLLWTEGKDSTSWLCGRQHCDPGKPQLFTFVFFVSFLWTGCLRPLWEGSHVPVYLAVGSPLNTASSKWGSQRGAPLTPHFWLGMLLDKL